MAHLSAIQRSKPRKPAGSRTISLASPGQRMLAFQGPAQPSPTLGGALNGGYPYLEVKCLGCDTHQTVALNNGWHRAADWQRASGSDGMDLAIRNRR
jgi:hypothetical protein